MNCIYNKPLNEQQIKALESSDEIVGYIILSLISTAISLYAIKLKRINIIASDEVKPPIDNLYIRKLAVITGIISIIIYVFYFNSSKKSLQEAKVKTKSLWLEYIANAIDFIPTLIRLYILLCMTTTDTITTEEIIAQG